MRLIWREKFSQKTNGRLISNVCALAPSLEKSAICFGKLNCRYHTKLVLRAAIVIGVLLRGCCPNSGKPDGIERSPTELPQHCLVQPSSVSRCYFMNGSQCAEFDKRDSLARHIEGLSDEKTILGTHSCALYLGDFGSSGSVLWRSGAGLFAGIFIWRA